MNGLLPGAGISSGKGGPGRVQVHQNASRVPLSLGRVSGLLESGGIGQFLLHCAETPKCLWQELPFPEPGDCSSFTFMMAYLENYFPT